MSLKDRRGKWQIRVKIKGQLYEKGTAWEATEANRKRAEREEKIYRDSILRGDISKGARTTGSKFTDVTNRFMDKLVFTKIKASSVTRIKVSMVSLQWWFQQTDLAKVDASAIDAYKEWRLRGDAEIVKVKPTTVRKDLAALSKFFRWAKKEKLVGANPVAEVEKPSDPDSEERIYVISPAEEIDFFDRCAIRGYVSLADVARLMLEQGMRPEEVLNLEKRGIDLDRGYIQIFKGKRNASKRKLKMTAASREILARRMWSTESARWLFPSPKKNTRGDVPMTKLNGPYDKVTAEWKAKGDQPARLAFPFEMKLYSFRHTFATRMAERGMGLDALKVILGHSTLRMVMKYVHPSQEHVDAQMVRIEAMIAAERAAAQTQSEVLSARPN